MFRKNTCCNFNNKLPCLLNHINPSGLIRTVNQVYARTCALCTSLVCRHVVSCFFLFLFPEYVAKLHTPQWRCIPYKTQPPTPFPHTTFLHLCPQIFIWLKTIFDNDDTRCLLYYPLRSRNAWVNALFFYFLFPFGGCFFLASSFISLYPAEGEEYPGGKKKLFKWSLPSRQDLQVYMVK